MWVLVSVGGGRKRERERELTPWWVGIYTVLQILELLHGRVNDANIRHERKGEMQRERERERESSNCI